MADAPRRSNFLSWLDAGLDKAESFVVAVTMLLMAGNSIANVIGRYAFSQSIYFSEELNEILMVLVTFVGVAYVTRRGQHIRMSALYDLLPDRGRKIFMIVIALTTGITMLALAWFAAQYALRVAARGQVTPALQLPLWTIYIWVVVGFVATAVQYFLTALRNFDLSDPTVFVSPTVVDSYEDPELSEIIRLHDRDNKIPATLEDGR